MYARISMLHAIHAMPLVTRASSPHTSHVHAHCMRTDVPQALTACARVLMIALHDERHTSTGKVRAACMRTFSALTYMR